MADCQTKKGIKETTSLIPCGAAENRTLVQRSWKRTFYMLSWLWLSGRARQATASTFLSYCFLDSTPQHSAAQFCISTPRVQLLQNEGTERWWPPAS